MQLDGVRLLVKDFDGCFRFYSKRLGLKVTWGKIGGDYASFDVGMPSGLSLFRSDLMAGAVGNMDKELPADDDREKIAIIFKVEDVDDAFSKLSANGVKFINTPKDMTGWGIRVAHFRDPKNNLLELWSELPKEKWDKDLLDQAQEFEG